MKLLLVCLCVHDGLNELPWCDFLSLAPLVRMWINLYLKPIIFLHQHLPLDTHTHWSFSLTVAMCISDWEQWVCWAVVWWKCPLWPEQAVLFPGSTTVSRLINAPFTTNLSHHSKLQLKPLRIFTQTSYTTVSFTSTVWIWCGGAQAAGLLFNIHFSVRKAGSCAAGLIFSII